MEKAKVYFTDMRTGYGGLSLPQKLAKLIKAAGIGILISTKSLPPLKFISANPATYRICAPTMPRLWPML
mgnify:CR=1 FL=1